MVILTVYAPGTSPGDYSSHCMPLWSVSSCQLIGAGNHNSVP